MTNKHLNTAAVTRTCTRVARHSRRVSISSKFFFTCFWFRARAVSQVTGSGTFDLPIVNHDMYTAYLVLCQRGGSFSGDVTLTYLNPVPEGGLTQHLPIQLAMLPALYTVSSELCKTLSFVMYNLMRGAYGAFRVALYFASPLSIFMKSVFVREFTCPVGRTRLCVSVLPVLAQVVARNGLWEGVCVCRCLASSSNSDHVMPNHRRFRFSSFSQRALWLVSESLCFVLLRRGFHCVQNYKNVISRRQCCSRS